MKRGGRDSNRGRPPSGAGPGKAARITPRPRPAVSRATAVLVVFVVALAIRVSLSWRLEGSLLGGVLLADSQSYWDWASRLLRGETETEPYFLAPLYPHLLAALRRLAGGGATAVLLVQCGFGALASALVADAASRRASPIAGLLAGLVAASLGPLVLHDNLVLSESVLFLLGSAWVWLALGRRAGTAALLALLGLGALTGLLALGRGTNLVLLVLLPLVPFELGGRRRRAAALAAAAVAAAMVVAPATLHNFRVSGEFIPTTYSAGYNLAVGFGPGATGGFTPPTGTSVLLRVAGSGRAGGVEWDGRDEIRRRTGRSLTPRQSSAWWANVAARAVGADPLRALRLAGLKALMLVNRREYPQIENLRTYERLLGPVGLPSAFAIPVVLALALVALRLRWASDAGVRCLGALVLVQVAVLLPFFVTDRYRLHLLPALLVLAAIGGQELWKRASRKDRTARQPHPLPWLALGLVLSLLPLPGVSRAREAWGTGMDLGERALQKGQYALAVRYLSEAARVEEQGGRAWGRAESMRVPLTAHAFALGRALAEGGNPDAARPWFERAKRLSPDLPELDAWLARTASPEASRLTGRERAVRLAQAGRFAEAESLFADLVRSPDPGFHSWGALVRLRAMDGRVAEARRTLEAGARAGWAGPAYELHATLVLALEGRRSEAASRLARIDDGAMRGDPTLADLHRVVRQVLSPAGR